jgi:hypothetical protein
MEPSNKYSNDYGREVRLSSRTAREALEQSPFIVGTMEGENRFATLEEAEKWAAEYARRGKTVGVFKLTSITEPAVLTSVPV